MALGILESLPPETIDNIVSRLDKPALSAVRHLNHYLEPFAARWHFRKIRFRTGYFRRGRHGLVNIAKSTKLNRLVRSVVCTVDLPVALPFYPNLDMNIEETFIAMDPEDRDVVVAAAHVLPFLAHFRHLITLKLVFIEFESTEHYTPASFDVIDFQSGIIETIFECLAGTWPLEKQTRIDQALQLVKGDEYDFSRGALPEPGLISLRALCISELTTSPHPRVRGSEAFKAVVGSGSIVHFSFVNHIISCRENEEVPLYSREELEMFEKMPQIWFIPSMAENLQILKLDFSENWGWHPKLNLEAIAPALPNLKKLSLWKFVFSHERQARWIASLGRNNLSGGLEELRLLCCHIVYRATHFGQLDSDTRYPIQEAMLRLNPLEDEQLMSTFFPLRWYTMLDLWRASMPALKSLRVNYYSDEDDDAERNRHIQGRGFLDYGDFDYSCWPMYEFVPNKRVPLAGGADPDYYTERDTRRPDVGRCQARDEEAASLLFSAVRSRKWPASRQNV
ncbi:hypothetical protein EDB80DRAFT_867160 [Ilyonectria destructans]|nr:hypothetical protein EDB80DRAFT_867160 [Ilyonectria destructans]